MNRLRIPGFYIKMPQVQEIINDPAFVSMLAFNHHGPISCYDHTLRVTEIAFSLALKFNADKLSTIRGALLHDLYLYDWHKGGPRLHGLHHPKIALKESIKRFVLNPVEKDIIRKHMFPLTPFPPVYLESWIVSIADKCSAVTDYTGLIKSYMLQKFKTANYI